MHGGSGLFLQNRSVWRGQQEFFCFRGRLLLGVGDSEAGPSSLVG